MCSWSGIPVRLSRQHPEGLPESSGLGKPHLKSGFVLQAYYLKALMGAIPAQYQRTTILSLCRHPAKHIGAILQVRSYHIGFQAGDQYSDRGLSLHSDRDPSRQYKGIPALCLNREDVLACALCCHIWVYGRPPDLNRMSVTMVSDVSGDVGNAEADSIDVKSTQSPRSSLHPWCLSVSDGLSRHDLPGRVVSEAGSH